MSFFLENIISITSVLFFLYIIGVLFFIIMENRDSASTFSWMLVFILLPVIGLVVYIFFGKNWRLHSRQRKAFKKKLEKNFTASLNEIRKKENDIFRKTINKNFNHYKKTISLLLNFNNSILTENNSAEILQNGKMKFIALEKDLRNAKKFIHLQYFIWRDDTLTRKIKNILIEKAKSGVKIRILYDPMGSILFWLKGRGYRKELKKVGIQIEPFFNSMTRSKLTRFNNINHWKIAIIDGLIGYTGGMNMGEEYISGKPKFESWRDTQIKIKGEAVYALNALFAYSWNEVTKESLFNKEYFPSLKEKYNSLPIQIIPSGPDSEEEYARQLYLAMINAGKKNVYIQSPYFIPDKTIHEALKISAMSGIDTRVIITGIPDKKIVYWAAFSFFEKLLYAGVRIYHYQKGFMHAKTITVDSKFCTIGTTNMDIRSFSTSHEVNAVIYDSEISTMLEKDFIKDLNFCKEFTIEDYEKLNTLTKFRNSLARLLTPLL